MCGCEDNFFFVLVSPAINESCNCLLDFIYDVLVGEGEYGCYVEDFRKEACFGYVDFCCCGQLGCGLCPNFCLDGLDSPFPINVQFVQVAIQVYPQ